MDRNIVLALAIVTGLIYLVMVLRWPHVGLAGIAASLPISVLLPDVGIFTSVAPVIGLVTLVSYLLHRLTEPDRPWIRLGGISVLGLLLIVWMFATNPDVAWSGANRNWVLTYVQLWAVAWLASELLDTPRKHHLLMAAFAIAVVASAVAASLGASLGDDIYSSIRVPGFTDGANTASRYFVVGLVFMNYLRTTTKRRLPRILLLAGMMVAVLGVFATVSRTGVLLLFASVALMLVLNPRGKNQGALVVVVILGFLILSWASDSLTNIMKSILPSIVEGTDTVGLRYKLWTGAWRMWKANPIAGVGVGTFVDQLHFYASDLLTGRYLRLVTHNMYLQMLAETGAVGFVLFTAMLALAFASIWRARRTTSPDEAPVWLPWFIAFSIMLLGGVTKSDQFDKLVWLGVGIGWYFSTRAAQGAQSVATIPSTPSPGPARVGFPAGRSLTVPRNDSSPTR